MWTDKRDTYAFWPAQLAYGLITLTIIDQILDIDLQRWTPGMVWDNGMSSVYTILTSTTLESNMSQIEYPKVMLVTFFESAPSARASRLSQLTEFLNPQPEQGEEALARDYPCRDIVLAHRGSPDGYSQGVRDDRATSLPRTAPGRPGVRRRSSSPDDRVDVRGGLRGLAVALVFGSKTPSQSLFSAYGCSDDTHMQEDVLQ